jgi:transcriptional regulator with XRE-family HTH domain
VPEGVIRKTQSHTGKSARPYIELNRFIGERIRQSRKQKRLSQAGLGEKLGISYQQIQKYEYGTSSISVSRLYQVADALDESIEVFLPKNHLQIAGTNDTDNGTPPFDLDAVLRKLKRKGKKKKMIEVLEKLSELVG